MAYDTLGNHTGEYKGSDDTERKTNGNSADNAKTQIVNLSGEGNVFNKYRSITYKFTLSALEERHLKDPTTYRDTDLKLIILQSGGKGDAKMVRTLSTNDSAADPAGVGVANSAAFGLNTRRDGGVQRQRLAQSMSGAGSATSGTADDKAAARTRRNSGALGYKVGQLFDGFNTDSPGRFDLFMENVEIENMMAPCQENNMTTAQKIKFDVIEPYSINGFIEALHVASVAAGYPSYQNAVFLLKIEFWGYPDGKDFPDPEKVPNTDRYFPISFNEVNVEITEKGTLYRCNAVPYNERGFGHPSVTKKPIKMQGSTVGEVLKNLFKALDDASKEIQKLEDEESGVKSKDYDRYEIKFPVWDEKLGWDYTKENSIVNSKMGDVLTSEVLVEMNDPDNKDGNNAYRANNAKKSNPSDPPKSVPRTRNSVVQFNQDRTISEVISAVIRDSDYVPKLLKGLMEKGSKVKDDFGFVDYWLIRIEIINSKEINQLGKKPFQTFRFIVSNYKIHYTRIPGYGRERINSKDLEKISNRDYNWLYTGKNIDVLNFKLNFNNLYFEAIPFNNGSKPTSGTSDKASPGEVVNIKLKEPAENTTVQGNRETGQVPDPAVKVISTRIQANYTGNSGQPKEDPYALLARTMYDAVINSNASMLTGELEILGDPFYLGTAGVGNFNPTPANRGQTKTGEINQHYGAVIITITFRNPEDINSFEDGGMMRFDSNRVPFSGAYQVNTVLHTFKDGLFKQKLNVLRIPGQVLDSDLRSSDPADRMTTKPKPGSQVLPDTSRAGGSPQPTANGGTVPLNSLPEGR
jgi:hypothetical protein